MGYANIDALYAGSLRIKISFFFLSNFTFYKWCVTKVAHCSEKLLNIIALMKCEYEFHHTKKII